MAFDPCREWLGIDADDLSDPRRVLGLPRSAGGAEAVMRAAEARLESLGRVSPGPFAKAHAALIRRVEEARDSMLGAAASDSPARAAGDASLPVDFPSLAPGRGGRRRRRKAGSGGLLLPAIALLGLAGAVLAFLVIRPDRASGTSGQRGIAADSGQQAANRQQREATERAQRDDEKRKAEEQARRDEQARRAAEQARRDEQATKAAEQAQRAETQPDEKPRGAEQARTAAARDGALAKAYEALRQEDFDAADRLLADEERQVGDDVEAATRLERWRLLAGYAREFTRFRAQAFAAANEGREYEIDGSRFAIIEITPEMFVFRQAGQNKRVPRAEVDPRLEMAIVEAWFAGDGRAANHLFLGAGWLCLDSSDLRRARAEWTIAGEGGEAAEPLLALLDDPVIRQAGS